MAQGVNIEAAIMHCINPDSIADLAGEERVAELLVLGCNYRQIAEICGYKDRASANAQVQRIRRKLGWQAQ